MFFGLITGIIGIFETRAAWFEVGLYLFKRCSIKVNGAQKKWKIFFGRVSMFSSSKGSISKNLHISLLDRAFAIMWSS